MVRTLSRLQAALAFAAVVVLMAPGAAVAQTPMLGEPLLETPIHPLPKTMTFEDYVDANRRITMGLLYSPIPGGLHFYGGERSTGWTLVAVVGGGVASIVLGAIAAEKDGSWSETSYETVDIGETRYAKVPIATVDKELGGETSYRLTALDRNPGGGAVALMVVGVGAIVGAYVYDFFDGIAVIEAKRDRARYKYGLLAGGHVTLAPVVDADGGRGLAMNMRF